ncbi:hypothetical protein [Sphaerisporangium sp. NPDC051011]
MSDLSATERTRHRRLLPLAHSWQAPITDPLAARPVPGHILRRTGMPF